MTKIAASKATPKAVKPVKATKAKAPKAIEPIPEPTIPEPIVEPAAEPAPVEQPAAQADAPIEAESLKQRFEKLIQARISQMAELKREVAELRKMQRDHESAIKEAAKKNKKKKAPRDDSAPRKPSGFASPVIVSDELYSFLERFGVKKGEPVARTDVTKYMTSYIKEHNLQNPELRREILPDSTLKSLFGPATEPKDPSDANSPKVYTYLKLQSYLSKHFPKKQA